MACLSRLDLAGKIRSSPANASPERWHLQPGVPTPRRRALFCCRPVRRYGIRSASLLSPFATVPKPAAPEAKPPSQVSARSAKATAANQPKTPPPNEQFVERLMPGVWLNKAGVAVDSRNVAIGFLELKRADQQRFEEVIGKAVETPAELLKAVCLDPRQPLRLRIQVATQAAPYFDRKKPQAIELPSGDPLAKLDFSRLSAKELDAFLALATKAGLVEASE